MLEICSTFFRLGRVQLYEYNNSLLSITLFDVSMVAMGVTVAFEWCDDVCIAASRKLRSANGISLIFHGLFSHWFRLEIFLFILIHSNILKIR